MCFSGSDLIIIIKSLNKTRKIRVKMRRRIILENDKNIHPFDPNGHAYVDLGLPSGTMWSTKNVGASSITDYGNYYQYGKGSRDYSVTSGESYYKGTEDPLALSADTAAQVWGGSWNTPTWSQITELYSNTTYQWTIDFNGTGISGGVFTSTADTTQYIFMPAAGYHSSAVYDAGKKCYAWSSSKYYSSMKYILYADSNGCNGTANHQYRDLAISVRPVIQPQWVDLGLPSGLLWAKYNVGARMEHEYGNYYQWGKGARDYFVASGESSYAGSESTLVASADTATQAWGDTWRMPTITECQELVGYTTYQWVTNFNSTGISGGKLTAANGNYIFIPAAGWYNYSINNAGQYGYIWSSTHASSGANARNMYVSNGGVNPNNSSGSISYGESIRPVRMP